MNIFAFLIGGVIGIIAGCLIVHFIINPYFERKIKKMYDEQLEFIKELYKD